MWNVKTWATWGGLVAAGATYLACRDADLSNPASITAAVTAVCAIWWMFEAIPIAATSLVPLAVFPVFGILDHKQVAGAYGDKLVLLLLGGSILSQAMEKSGVHRRLALGMVRAVGGYGGRRLVLGFMVASAVLSMWISNTATTLMLLPIALAVVADAKDQRLTIPLLLGMAYAASVGGLGTPIGTTPNLLFLESYNKHLAETDRSPITFLGWMKMGLPVVFIMLPIIWLWVTRGLGKAEHVEIPKSGAWRSPEWRVLVVFSITALAWMFRKQPFGGWSDWFNTPIAHDSSVALIACVLLFLLPDGEGGKLLDWKSAVRVPWGLFILFGGGIALARAFDASGLSQVIGDELSGITNWSPVLMIFAVCLTVTFLTEVTSNTATTALLMPILLAAGKAANIDPALLMMPAVLSASCAFMLPVATAPNAIVFGTEKFTVARMAREGLIINLIGACVITALCMVML